MTTETETQERLIDVAEVASRVGVHEDTIGKWWRSKRFLPPVAVSPRIKRWRSADVDAWIAAHGATDAQIKSTVIRNRGKAR